jgi:serine protease Do
MNFIKALFLLLFFGGAILACKTSENIKPGESMSLRDSLKVLTDSLKRYQTATQNTEAKDIVPLKELYKKLKPAVFLIYTVGNGEDISDTAQGSGFFVDSSGIAISNYHVFESAGRAVAITEDGNKYPISQILDFDQDKDFVVFRVSGGNMNFPYVKRHRKEVEVGDDCFAVGNPQGLTQTLSTGIISGVRLEGKIIQTTTPITFGSSGGPLFNREGEAIGITSGGMGSGNLNFAVSLDQIAYEKYLGGVTIPPLPEDIEPKIRQKLTAYFKTIITQQFDDVKNFYADNLYRFYSKFNISSIKAAAFLEEDWKVSRIESGKIVPHWKTLSMQRNLWAYEVQLNADYYLVRAEKKKPSHFNLNMIIEFDKDLLIQSIYENILSKTN